MTGNPPLIDTNVLVYAFDTGCGEKQTIAKELLVRCWKNEVNYAVSIQNLAEFSTVVVEKVTFPAPAEDVRQFLTSIISYNGWTVLTYGAHTVIRAHEIRYEYKLHFWDALLAATMEENAIRTILTEDAHFSRVPWITVINPFERNSR
jgi:predicted nucleic acid-binding protein